jgi:SAM-dependent methyltransferase
MSAITTIDTKDFGKIPVRRRDCPLCGRNNDHVPAGSYSVEPWTIKECADCSFVYIDDTPHYSMQFEVMAWERTTKVEERRRAEIRPISYKASKRTRFRLHLLPRHSVLGYIPQSGGNVVDLGCGSGQTLSEFPSCFIPFGIEISSNLAAAADDIFRQRGGCVVNAPCVEGLGRFSDGFFIAASLRGYLEHEAEPLPVLKNLHRALASHGVAVVKVPNYASWNRRVMGRRWCGFRYPDHLNYFTPKTLGAMAAKAGFDIGFGISGRIPTSDNIWAILSKRAG